LEAPIAKLVQQVDTREACSNDDYIQVLDWLFSGTHGDGYGKVL
jgi:hypothetical protein